MISLFRSGIRFVKPNTSANEDEPHKQQGQGNVRWPDAHRLVAIQVRGIKEID